MQNAKTYRTSVKKLVDFACRSGDLVHTGPAGPTAAEGQIAHKKLQQQKDNGEQAEVKVTTSITRDHLTLKLGGRVDLLKIPTNSTDVPTVGEIKSCHAPSDKQPKSTVDLHWAQLKIYGYCILTELRRTYAATPHTSINLRLIWVNLQSDSVEIDARLLQFAELEQFAHCAADRYLQWMNQVTEKQLRLQQSSKALQFPHSEFRQGQRQMAASIYVTTRDKKTLLCEAPTGIGKTVSALFPAIKAIGEKHVEAVVYLTAKNSGRHAANDCIRLLESAGAALTAVTITAKKSTCHCSNGTCIRNDDGRCPLTIGFFDRLPEAREELLQKGVAAPADVDEMAHKYQLCPFELTLQMLPWVSVIVCDYNYVFDPLVRLTHFTENASRQLLLIDEAHNLTERARSMYSAQLIRTDIKMAARECTKYPLMVKEFERVIRAMDRWAKSREAKETASDEPPTTISRAINKCVDTLSALAENNIALSDKTIDVAKALYRYRVIAELFGDQHRTITHIPTATNTRYTSNINVQLRCLNATQALHQSLKQFRSTTVFSATLRPQQFSRDCLGLPEDTYCLTLNSPFPQANQGTLLCSWIDTRYRARDSAIDPIVKLTAHIYNTKRGNYQIFFPSYLFMEKVYTAFRRSHPNIPTIIQQRDATDSTRQQFLQNFESNDAILAFSILGGIYGEGVDYTGDKLIGAIVIGTGLPSLSLEQKLIEQDYNHQGLNGFDYASRYPGMTRVLQTAGRVIRSEHDKGVVILVDQRLTEPFYQPLFPSHWQVVCCNDLATLQHSLSQFWKESSGTSNNNDSACELP